MALSRHAIKAIVFTIPPLTNVMFCTLSERNRKFCKLFLHALWLVIIPSTAPRLPRKTAAASRATCATPATWNEGCHQVPRLPRKPRRHGRQIRTKRATQCHKCHACHPKRRWMWVCATPATWNERGCHQMPCLPRKVPRRHRRQSGPSAPGSTMSATPATQNDGRCEFVPRLPREMNVDVTKCHACHAKCRGVTGDKSGPSAPPSTMSATPATQNDRGCQIVPRLPRKTTVDVNLCHACHEKWRWMSPSATQLCVCECVWSYCMLICVCVWKYCMWNYCMLSLCVCVKSLYVRDGMWRSCVYVSVCEIIVC